MAKHLLVVAYNRDEPCFIARWFVDVSMGQMYANELLKNWDVVNLVSVCLRSRITTIGWRLTAFKGEQITDKNIRSARSTDASYRRSEGVDVVESYFLQAFGNYEGWEAIGESDIDCAHRTGMIAK